MAKLRKVLGTMGFGGAFNEFQVCCSVMILRIFDFLPIVYSIIYLMVFLLVMLIYCFYYFQLTFQSHEVLKKWSSLGYKEIDTAIM